MAQRLMGLAKNGESELMPQRLEQRTVRPVVQNPGSGAMPREIQSGETYTIDTWGIGDGGMMRQRLWDVDGRLVLDRYYRADDPPENDCTN